MYEEETTTERSSSTLTTFLVYEEIQSGLLRFLYVEGEKVFQGFSTYILIPS